MARRRAWLIDASIYIFRAWFSLPERWHTVEGRPVHAVYGYARFLLDCLVAARDAPYVAAAFDESLGSNYRNAIYPGYKASRLPPDDDLAFQLSTCRRLTEALGIPSYGCDRFEADDYLATLARLARERRHPVTVVTRDKDLGQLLLGPEDVWRDTAAGERLDAVAFQSRFGVAPGQFADYLALTGDAIDDIPGVPGVGAKTASALLREFGDLATLGEALRDGAALPVRGASRVRASLREHWPQVLLARRLTALEERIPGIRSLPRFTPRADAVERALALLRDCNLERPLMRGYRAFARELTAA